jgi:hypothetical protein
MPPDHSQAPERRFPSRIGPDRDTAERRLALLTNWSTGALATAIAMAVALPFAIAGAHRTPQGFLTAWHGCRRMRFARSDRPRG